MPRSSSTAAEASRTIAGRRSPVTGNDTEIWEITNDGGQPHSFHEPGDEPDLSGMAGMAHHDH